ncbi:MAG: hypothetical protein M1479_10655 [Actinobacteria bacterium]|nr:hypothetical protein [Actinomycetota bacterium]
MILHNGKPGPKEGELTPLIQYHKVTGNIIAPGFGLTHLIRFRKGIGIITVQLIG